MVSVQPEGCQPIIRAFENGDKHATPWECADSIFGGIRVPAAIGDYLILQAVRESKGTAIAVTDTEIKEADADSEIKEAGEKGMCDCGKPNFICKGKCKGDCDDSDDSDDDKDDDKQKEASSKPSFTKVANLTSEEKTRLGKFWKNIYPSDFVDAMLADK